MSSTLDPKRLFVESVPVAEILLLWSLVAIIADAVALGLRLAGVTMAFVYVLARADAVAQSRTTWPRTGSKHVRENWRVLLAATPWILAALVTRVLPPLVQFGVPPLYRSLFDPLLFAITGAAAGTALLYAAAFGITWIRQGRQSRDGSVSDADRSSDGSNATAGD